MIGKTHLHPRRPFFPLISHDHPAAIQGEVQVPLGAGPQRHGALQDRWTRLLGQIAPKNEVDPSLAPIDFSALAGKRQELIAAEYPIAAT